MLRKLSLLPVTLLAIACSPSSDFQGMPPEAYQAVYPKTNTVENFTDSHLVYFSAGKNSLSAEAEDSLRMFFSDIPPTSAESVMIVMRKPNDDRAHYLIRKLRALGFARSDIHLSTAASVARDSARIDVVYTVAIPPNCPDWRKSASHNFSNTLHSNMGCASVTNLGLMVADPRDLERGHGNVTPDPTRSSLAVQKYRSGADISAGSTSSGSSSGGTQEASTSAAAASSATGQ